MRCINLLPWREQLARRQKIYFLAALLSCLSLTFIIIATTHCWLTSKLAKIQANHAALQQKISQLDRSYKNFQQLKQQQERAQQKLNFLHNLHKANDVCLRFLQIMPQLIVAGSYLDQLHKMDHELKIMGYADSY